MAALSHLRFPVERARGRRYPEFPHPYRNEFQRDRDRIVHARAFRRLENKTQVFTPGLSDHFRNRLTHTIEVSQIARTVAATLGLDESLTEALALAHDIGHPPFAHAGEEELDRLMQRFGERFEHNLQALRIVESFENPYARFPGLNLTFEVREGIVKHSRDFAARRVSRSWTNTCPGCARRSKPSSSTCAMRSPTTRPIWMTAIAPGWSIRGDRRRRRRVARFGELWEAAEMQFPGAPEQVRMKEVVRGLINWLVSGLIEGTVAAAAGLNGLDDVREHPSRIARFTEATAAGRAN